MTETDPEPGLTDDVAALLRGTARVVREGGAAAAVVGGAAIAVATLLVGAFQLIERTKPALGATSIHGHQVAVAVLGLVIALVVPGLIYTTPLAGFLGPVAGASGVRAGFVRLRGAPVALILADLVALGSYALAIGGVISAGKARLHGPAFLDPQVLAFAAGLSAGAALVVGFTSCLALATAVVLAEGSFLWSLRVEELIRAAPRTFLVGRAGLAVAQAGVVALVAAQASSRLGGGTGEVVGVAAGCLLALGLDAAATAALYGLLRDRLRARAAGALWAHALVRGAPGQEQHAALEGWVAEDPTSPAGWFLLARERRAGGDLAGARAALVRFLELAPDAPDAPVARRALEELDRSG